MTELQIVDFETGKLLHVAGYPFEIAECKSVEEPLDPNSVYSSNYWRPKFYLGVSYRKLKPEEELPADINLPTIALAIRWLREEKGIYITIDCTICHTAWYYAISLKDSGRYEDEIIMLDTYDHCELAGLAKALHLLKEIQTNV